VFPSQYWEWVRFAKKDVLGSPIASVTIPGIYYLHCIVRFGIPVGMGLVKR
jgi:hypothetical protein